MLWDIEIQTNHVISARQLNLKAKKKKQQKTKTKKKKKTKKKQIVVFVIPAEQRIKLKKREKRDVYLDLGREVYGTWRSRWYQLLLVHTEKSPKDG